MLTAAAIMYLQLESSVVNSSSSSFEKKRVERIVHYGGSGSGLKLERRFDFIQGLFESPIVALKKQIESFNSQDSKWKNYVDELPSEKATKIGVDVLMNLSKNNLIPEKVSAAIDGGIILEVLNSQYYLAIEIDNDGIIGFVKEEGEGVESNTVNIDQLKNYIDSLANVEA